jgi:hypothetical protein
MTDTTSLTMLDISKPEMVGIEFSADGETMWVCVDGICRLRVKGLAVIDARKRLYDRLTGADE